jgi:hypothetical protein
MPMDATTANPPRRRWGLRFSLRSLLLVMLLVAVYFGGRGSQNWPYLFTPNLAGSWTANMPSGHKQPTTLKDLGKGQFLLSSRAGVLSGTYQWKDGELTVVTPADQRMMGLVWRWDGRQLVLVGEPGNTPTGSSYVGTTLDRAQP